tara:strand:+ start:1796 stop:2446 length:651 start_codon:yes stop_codon:yes gene_type:complete
MFRMNLEDDDSYDECDSCVQGGGGDMTYTLNKWYRYEAIVLLQNLDKINTIFPGKLYLSAEDIIEHIVYSKHGAYVLLENLRGLKKRLREIENKIKTGKWNSKYTAGLSKLNSENIDTYINDISNIHKLELLNNLIHEDLYMAYFVNSYPNIKLTEPKLPHFPLLPRESVSVNNKDRIKKLINNSMSYLSSMEKFHSSMTKLSIEVNSGLDKIISM